MVTPQLEVEGVGPVSLPLLPVQQAKQLIAVADQAPYGRGEQTLLDSNVRRTWQIDADRVRIAGRHWEGTLEAIVARAAEGLGVTAPVVAELYKLLVYDQGSFFVSHRDTEKAPGMFATLVSYCPSSTPVGNYWCATKTGKRDSTCTAQSHRMQCLRRSMPTAYTRCDRSPRVAG